MEPDRIHAVVLRAPAPGDFEMTNKPDPKGTSKNPAEPHPGMMGDGTEGREIPTPASKKTKSTPPLARTPRRQNNAHPNRCKFAYKGRAGSRPALSCQEMPMTTGCGEP
jgi:hypothetical protein